MKKHLLFTILACASMTAYALSTDKDQPIEVRADKFNGDEVKQTAVYSGSVQVTQGSMSLKGDRLELRLTPKGYRQATVSGKPAKFRQKKEAKTKGVEEWINAQAATIQYDEENDVVTLSGNAKLSRTENGVERDVTQGSRIVYDLRNARSVVEGGGSGGRVTTIIAPRSKPQPQTSPELSSTSSFTDKK